MEHRNANVNEINSSGDGNRVAQAGRDVDQGDIIHVVHGKLVQGDEVHGTKIEKQKVHGDLIHGGQNKTLTIGNVSGGSKLELIKISPNV